MSMTQVEFQTILAEKVPTMTQQQLETLFQTAVRLYKIRRSNEGFAKAQAMTPGDIVRVVGGIRPKSWIGTVATVVRAKQTKVMCQLKDGRNVTFPANVLEVVDLKKEVKP